MVDLAAQNTALRANLRRLQALVAMLSKPPQVKPKRQPEASRSVVTNSVAVVVRFPRRYIRAASASRHAIYPATLMGYQDLIAFVDSYRVKHPRASKQQVAAATAAALSLSKDRSVYRCEQYAVRFSSAKVKSFSNAVLSLSALRKVDTIPFIVVVLLPSSTEYLLANTTFLKKIGHSSHELRVDNVRGSFLGHDIIRDFDGIPNSPLNFDTLFSIHQEFEWGENLERLVDATNAIAGRGKRFAVSEVAADAIMKAPELAAELVRNPAYRDVKRQLAIIVQEKSAEILDAASIDNVNVRGNRIEQLITGGINEHGLADLVRHVGEIELHLEIKTKLMDRASNPKAYNIDKALKALSSGRTVIAFCFVGIHVASRRVTASTVSILDRTVLAATRIRFHWAGRNSRGVTQLTGNLAPLFSPNYEERIDVAEGQKFLRKLLDL